MNNEPKTVLCFGDSNTFGQRSDDVNKGRWGVTVRWTRQLQQMLGADYLVIEEGLSSRTTDIDYTQKPGRNGRTYLLPCLQSHNPLNTVVLMLGTNDLKDEFKRTSADIAQAVAGLVDLVHEYAYSHDKEVTIIIVSPIHINDNAQNFKSLYGSKYSSQSASKSRLLAADLRAVAQQKDCIFMDAAAVAQAGIDGIHFNKASHQTFAAELARVVTAKT